MNAASDYVRTGRHGVGGWFDEVDGWAFIAADAAQRALEVEGDLLEIGVYLGRSAILLGLLASPHERMLALDLFGGSPGTAEQAAENGKWYEGLALGAFEGNYRRFVPGGTPTILHGSSEQLLPSLLAGCARVIHVDGAHAFDAVRADIAQAVRIANPDAVIVFDDMTTAHTPGVPAAVWGAVLEGALVPLAQSRQKLYTTLPGSRITSQRFEAEALKTPLRSPGTHMVGGWPVLELSPPHLDPGGWQRWAADWMPPVAHRAARRAARRLAPRLSRHAVGKR